MAATVEKYKLCWFGVVDSCIIADRCGASFMGCTHEYVFPCNSSDAVEAKEQRYGGVKMKRKVHVAALIIALAVCVALLGAWQNNPIEVSQGRMRDAVNTVRLINTAELNEQHAHGKFVSFSQLTTTGTLQTTAKERPQFGSVYSLLNLQDQSELIPGFATDVVVSSDGSLYKLSFVEKAKCGAALFTDQNGIIYRGAALGCDKEGGQSGIQKQ
jgi:hypothetical protein